MELIKQRLVKQSSGSEMSFKAIEGYSMAKKKLPPSRRLPGLSMEDFRDFLKHASGGNVYPVDKELHLLFDRLDRDQDGIVSLPDFAAGISPFMMSGSAGGKAMQQ